MRGNARQLPAKPESGSTRSCAFESAPVSRIRSAMVLMSNCLMTHLERIVAKTDIAGGSAPSACALISESRGAKSAAMTMP